MLKITSIGGGTGLFTLLQGLKKYNCELTAVVSMADDGGSSGKLRDEFGILPPGDLRKCIVALSESSELMRKIFEHRFTNGSSLSGHSLGNLIITASTEIFGPVEGIKKTCELLNIKGKVLPVTIDNVRLNAELENGEIVKGETNIDIPKHDTNLKIRKIFLSPVANIHSDAQEEISNSDIITIGPGDLYTSVLPNLLVKGVPEAIKKSGAKVIYICNLMTKKGETDNFTVQDFINEVEKYLGKQIDYVLFNSKQIEDLDILESYKLEGKEQIKFTGDGFSDKFVGLDFLNVHDIVRHDSEKLGKAVVRLGLLESLKKD